MIRRGRLTATIAGDFVVLPIGLRIDASLKIRKWLPVLREMPRMLAEVDAKPELGLLDAATRFARTTLMMKYRRARQLDEGNFVLSDAPRQGDVEIRSQRTQPRKLTSDGEPDLKLFAFQLVTASDRPRLSNGQTVDLT